MEFYQQLFSVCVNKLRMRDGGKDILMLEKLDNQRHTFKRFSISKVRGEKNIKVQIDFRILIRYAIGVSHDSIMRPGDPVFFHIHQCKKCIGWRVISVVRLVATITK